MLYYFTKIQKMKKSINNLAKKTINKLFTLRDTADTVNLLASESDLDGTSLNYIELVGLSLDPSALILFFIFC